MSAEPTSEAPIVEANVKIIPQKRTARYSVALSDRGHALSASVNVKSVTFGASSDIPKTLEAADAIIALAQAVRAELIEQGVTE